MTEVSPKEFLNRVTKSRAVETKRLQEWLGTVETTDAMDLASKLVRDQLLTQWQAKYLMSGRTRLDIGSYRLLERIQRDELGDRFLAIHNQLGRKVEIQVLPLDLTRDQQRCDAFISKASLAAKLDHPNLSHVYDIDQEGGRYFLVTEHLDGVTLDMAPRVNMTEFDVARIVKQAISGLKFAHENQVVHSDLTQHDLQLVNSHEIKIKNIAVSPLRSTSKDLAEDKVYLLDYKAIAQIGYSVLKEIPQSNGSSHRESLTTMLRSLASGDADSIKLATSELSDWWAEHAPDSAKSGILSDAAATATAAEDEPFDFSLPGDGEYDGGFDQPVASALSATPRKSPLKSATNSNSQQEDFDDEDDSETPSWLTRLAHENPVGLMATVAVLALMLIAGGGYVLHSILWKDNQPITRNTVAKPVVSIENGANMETTAAQPSGLLSKPQTELEPVDFSDPEAMQRQIAAALGTSADPANPIKNKPETPKPETPKPETPKPETPKPETPKPETPKPETPKPETPKPETPAVEENPFKKFPETVSLPALDDVTEFEIGKLVIHNRFLLGAEILSHENVSRSKAVFVLDRDSADNQKWIVTAKRNARDNGEPIATFRKSETAFLFQWLPEASGNKQAGYLQNCLIKLLIPDQACWLKLRTPIVVEPMKLTESEFSAEMEADFEYLPDPEIIAVEIMQSRVPDTSLSPGLIEFQQNLPGRILLMDEDPNAFVWVQVDAAFKSRFRARAEVKLYAAGRVQPVKNMNVLGELEAGLQMQKTLAFNEYNSKKDLQAPKDMKTKYDKAKADLLKASKVAQAQAEQGSQYVQLLPKFFDQPIGIRVVAKMDGHEVELLQTTMPPVPPRKAKPKK